MDTRLPAYRSRAWRDWTTRYPESEFSITYLKNCHRAAEFFLDAYVLAKPAQRHPFGLMLRRMHRLTVGSLRRVPFANYNPQSMSPGITRDRLVRSTPLGPLAPTDVFVRFAPELQACLWTLKRSLRNKQPIHGFPVTVQLAFRGRNYRFNLQARRDWICYYPQMAGVPRQSRFEIAIGERYLMGVPPSPKAVPRLLKRGERLLEKAIDIPSTRASRSRSSPARWLKSLAKYYQTMTVAHPFASQNNSLIMNQVNCLLFLHSGSYIPHGNLDGFALMLPASAFEKFFLDYVTDERKGRRNAPAH